MMLASICFTIMQSIIKFLPQFHVFQIVFFRCSITALFCLTYLGYYRIPLLAKNHNLLILRAIFGLVSMTLFFVTIQRMPFGASISLKYLSPVFTTIFAVLLLREKIGAWQWLFLFMALAGVFLLKGFDSRIDLLTLLMGITGALLAGLVYVIIRKIGNSDHPIVIVNYFMLSASLIMGLIMIPYWRSPNWQQGLLLLSTGVAGFFAQFFMTKALQAELASKVTPIKYIEVVYSLLIGLIWFDETYNMLSLLGMALIIGGMLLNVFYKNISRQT